MKVWENHLQIFIPCVSYCISMSCFYFGCKQKNLFSLKVLFFLGVSSLSFFREVWFTDSYKPAHLKVSNSKLIYLSSCYLTSCVYIALVWLFDVTFPRLDVLAYIWILFWLFSYLFNCIINDSIKHDLSKRCRWDVLENNILTLAEPDPNEMEGEPHLATRL